MWREIENDVRSAMSISNRYSDPPLEEELLKAWQNEIEHELAMILERLEAFDMSRPALHVENAIAALRNA